VKDGEGKRRRVKVRRQVKMRRDARGDQNNPNLESTTETENNNSK
jgi:hypothetical protein